jgi:hypothetical protein
VGTHDLPESLVAPLGEQMQVDFAQRGQEPVGVGDRVDVDFLTNGSETANTPDSMCCMG